jgi:cytochrome c551/c552
MKKTIVFLSILFVMLFLKFNISNVFAASGLSNFKSEGCIACHTINRQCGNVGPNLSHIGAKKSYKWIKTQITNPSSHFVSGNTIVINGKSYVAIMPGNKNMSKSRLNSIVTYLKNKK